MDFDSLTEFPPLSQVMSPKRATAQPRTFHEGSEGWQAKQTMAFVASGSESQPLRGARRRRADETSPRTPVSEFMGAGDAGTRGARGAPVGVAKTPGGRDRIALRTLDVGRPEVYDNWRLSARAAVACFADADDAVMEYLKEIDNASRSDADLVAGVRRVPALRALDLHLYAAIPDCLRGDRQETVLERIHQRAEFGQGCLALRCLDEVFQRSSAKRRAAATAEILHLAPRGPNAREMDDFLARFRTLLGRAGADIGPSVQADILQRAAAAHPVLGAVSAAWKRADGENATPLLEQLEAAVAEGLFEDATGRNRAWVATEAGATRGRHPMGAHQKPFSRRFRRQKE